MTRRAYALALALALTAPAMAQAQQARPEIGLAAGAVYTETNAVDHNEILAFHRAADGTLTPLIAFRTGGRGSGGTVDPLQSQNSVLLSDDHRFLFAVSSGSGEITSFAVLPNRELRRPDAVPSGGGFPVSLALSGDLLYVLNSGGAGDITGFRVRRSGRLTPLPASTQFLSGASAGGLPSTSAPAGASSWPPSVCPIVWMSFPSTPKGLPGRRP